MRSFHLLFAAALCLPGISTLAGASNCPAPTLPSADAADIIQASARLLAGLQSVSTHGEEIRSMAFWTAHAKAMDGAWQRTRERQLNLWRAFSEREIDALESARGPLFYPFSGPDFVYAHTLFPRAPRYLLVGLEDAGSAPRWTAMSEAQAAASLAQLRESTATLMRLSFFRTNSMKQDLQRGQLRGVAPVLMAMAARSGFDVRAVDEVRLDDSGALCAGTAKQTEVGGVRLVLAESGKEALRELVYLQVDLSDRALARTPQFERYLKTLGNGPVFLKAASYLLHKPYFGATRNLVLERARLVLQDDSGIPYQAYAPTEWSGRLYGAYVQPIGLFKARNQPALRQAYARNALPLDTGIGYSHRPGTSNLQLFEKRAARVTMQQAAMR